MENKREADLFGCWGGKEFLILCKENDEKGAEKVAQKIQSAIKAHDFKEVGPQTLSFGIASFKENESLDATFIRADKAMYDAKNSGKDKIWIR